MKIDLDRVEIDSAYREECQHRCITDHFFLAERLGHGFDKFIPRIHQPVVDLYFPKNPRIPIEEQHKIKYRLHLDPRGTYKTTMGRVDSLQWILAFPEEITILNETATKPLAEQISASIAKFLWKKKGAPATPLQKIFPHLCVEKEPGGVWDTPLHIGGVIDSTLAFTSPRSTQSGWHPWVECVDDMVETENSGIHATDEVRQAVIDTYYTNKNTLRPGGYINLRGTRYHPFELYGDVIDKMDPEQWKVLIRSAMIIKGGRKLLPGEFPDEDDIILNFPEMPGMDYRSLKEKFYDDYESFMCQQMNDPQGGHIATFDEDLYKSILIQPERIPNLGETYMCWRLPYGGKDYMAKNAEGAVARVWEGKVYILDAWQGSYTPSRLAEKIVKEAKEHHAEHCIMEELPGTEYMEGHIRNEYMKRSVTMRIQWVYFEDDDNVRGERIKQLEPQMRAGRVFISTGTGKAGELRSQLLGFGLMPDNGIVDCLSRLAAKVPINQMRQDIEDEEAELAIRRKHQMQYEFIHGEGRDHGLSEMEKRQKEAHEAAMQAINNIGLTDILGGLDG